ncbi:flagellar biosynthesis protein FlhB [Jeotgalibaca ciconiae]|uniref:Flagellar biosynthetic protein FlhB n=1 Tax=Jeotgalibaca ciconiae TaxID=2496265 RepID=A0A3Q9BKD1_9LACT|nr:flagellar biosynthesis protein FlhB [Jeotgalibaca ciconiae]AZP04285.1 flagellar biosynthesis protein FlhB [Jeotgalibaca ciconiae]
MSEKDGKTEKATPKKLRDARKKGELAKSQELSSSITFAIFALVGVTLVTYTLENAYPFLIRMLTIPKSVDTIQNDLNQIGLQAILYFFIFVGPFLLVGFVGAYLANVMQVGLLFSKEALKPKLSRLNPVSGLKNMFSTTALFNLAKNLAKLGLLLWVALSSAEEAGYYALNAGRVGTEKLFFLMLEIIKSVSANLAGLLFVLGAADFAYQKYSFQKKMRMSKQEIKDEYKEMEGDPQVKSQRKQKYRQLTRGMVKDVDTATVVITNPTHLAIAIRYDRSKDDVPIVVAKGADHMAAIIRERAKDHDVPIMENKPIARALYQTVDAGQSVPADMYQAIAEILALVYQMEELQKKKI